MNKIVMGHVLAAVLFFTAGCGQEQKAESSFSTIASQIDYGGECYQIVNTESFEKEIDDVIDSLIALAPEREQVRAYSSFRRVLKTSGVLSVKGVGRSVKVESASVGNPVYRHKSFVLLSESSADFWKIPASGNSSKPDLACFFARYGTCRHSVDRRYK